VVARPFVGGLADVVKMEIPILEPLLVFVEGHLTIVAEDDS
jgi:hypothetical protein